MILSSLKRSILIPCFGDFCREIMCSPLFTRRDLAHQVQVHRISYLGKFLARVKCSSNISSVLAAKAFKSVSVKEADAFSKSLTTLS